jgi:hypothetical protein
VLYFNPLNLIGSLQKVFSFVADPGAVEFMLNDLPSDPVAIEKAVLTRIPYRHDWELYSMPWYFPTIRLINLPYMCGWTMRVNRRPQLRMLKQSFTSETLKRVRGCLKFLRLV